MGIHQEENVFPFDIRPGSIPEIQMGRPFTLIMDAERTARRALHITAAAALPAAGHVGGKMRLDNQVGFRRYEDVAHKIFKLADVAPPTIGYQQIKDFIRKPLGRSAQFKGFPAHKVAQ